MKILENKKFFSLLIADNCFINLSHFAILSILSVYLLTVLKISPALSSLALMILTIALRMSRIVFLPLLNKISFRKALVFSFLLCIFGNSLMFLSSLTSLYLAMILIGIGYGMINLIIKVLISDFQNKTSSVWVRFSIFSTSLNVSAAVGPLIASYIFNNYLPPRIFQFSIGILLLGTVTSLILPQKNFLHLQTKHWFSTIKNCLKNERLNRLMIMTIFGWFLYAQLFSTIPLLVTQKLGAPHLLGTFFALNAVMIIFWTYPLAKFLEKFGVSLERLIVFSFLFYGLGCTILVYIQNIILVYGCVAFWTLGEILLIPAVNSLVSQYSQEENRMFAFSLNAIAMGIGEGLGYLFSINLSGEAMHQDNVSFQEIYLLLTILSVLFFIIADRSFFRKTTAGKEVA